MVEKYKIAEKLHELKQVEDVIEETLMDAFEKYEHFQLDWFEIGSDYYDNSIEIYINQPMPYPFEPCLETRQAIYDLGFDIVYWNFQDENERYSEEIRGCEPRRKKQVLLNEKVEHIHVQGVGYVDERFNANEWIGSKFDCRGKIKYATLPSPTPQTENEKD